MRYMVDDRCTDYIHICNSKNVVLDEEDVVITGDWQDQDKNVPVSGMRSSNEVMFAGAENQLQGRRPHIIDGKVKHDLTRRGVNAQNKRQRQHEEFINIGSKGLS
jgi:hypothetical protein